MARKIEKLWKEIEAAGYVADTRTDRKGQTCVAIAEWVTDKPRDERRSVVAEVCGQSQYEATRAAWAQAQETLRWERLEPKMKAERPVRRPSFGRHR